MYAKGNESVVLNAILESSQELFVALSTELKIVAFTQAFSNYCSKRFGTEPQIGVLLQTVLPWNTVEEGFWKRAFSGESFRVANGSQHQRYIPLGDNKGACKFIHNYSPVDIDQKSAFMHQDTAVPVTHNGLCCGTPEIVQKRNQNFHIMNEPGSLLWSLGFDGTFLASNVAWENFTGQTFEECKGWGWVNAHHPEDRDLLKRIWREIGSETSYCRYCARLWSAKTMQHRYILVHASLDTSGKQWNCVGLDINEMKQSKRSLKRLTNRLRLALTAASVGTWEWDFQNDIMTADIQDYHLFGVSSAVPVAVTFQRFLDAIHPEDRYLVEQKSWGCALNGTPYDVEFRVLWMNGTVHWLVGKGKRFFCKEGNPYMLGVNWDITATKEAEIQSLRALQQQEELRAAKQAAEFERQHKVTQEEFIDTVCHEIRNPLVGIYGGVNLVRDQLKELRGEILKLPENCRDQICGIISTTGDCLDSINQCADQQKIIVDDVLDLSKLEARKVELNPVPFNFKNCINTVLQMFRTKIKEKNLQVKVNLPQEDLWIKADLHRLQQIIINLVSNATKFTNVGEISIGAQLELVSPTESILTVQVQDTGIGIPAAELPHLFERFTQARRTSCARYGGSGLGLAISKRLVETMGGKISVTSQQGVGSTFQFTVQCQNVKECEKEEAQACTQQPGQEGNRVGRRHILIVDDNTMNQKILANFLEKEGHICRTASNGLEALEKCQQERYDLVFMDIEMPVMNGLEATRILRQREKGFRQPIVGLSGNARKEKIEAAFQAGMDDYLTKPYKRDEIINVINRKLESGSDQQHSKRQKLSSSSL